MAQFILGVMQRKKIFLRRLLRKRPAYSLDVLGFLPMGDYGILCLEPGFLTRNQREAIRKVLARKLKPVGGRYWVRINHFVAITKKSKGARMGKGRGGFHCEKSPTRPGQVLCEFSGLDISVARQLHRSLSKKLPVRTKFITNFF